MQNIWIAQVRLLEQVLSTYEWTDRSEDACSASTEFRDIHCLKQNICFQSKQQNPPSAPEGSELRIAQIIKAHKPEGGENNKTHTQMLRTPYLKITP